MNEKPILPIDSRPVFIEVPKPVKAMSKDERDSFVAEILSALEEKRWRYAQHVNLRPAYERFHMECQCPHRLLLHQTNVWRLKMSSRWSKLCSLQLQLRSCNRCPSHKGYPTLVQVTTMARRTTHLTHLTQGLMVPMVITIIKTNVPTLDLITLDLITLGTCKCVFNLDWVSNLN